MDYIKIIQRSWEITKTHHFMWWLGVIALFTQGVGLNLFSTSDISSQKLNIHRFDNTRVNEVFDRIQQYASNHIQLVTIIILTIIVICALLMYISYCARAGMIIAANDTEEKLNKRSHNYFLKGSVFAWRLFGLQITVSLCIYVVIVALGIPAYLMWANIPSSSGKLIFFLIYCLVVLIVYVACLLYASLFMSIASRFVVLRHKRIEQASRDAFLLIRFHGMTVVIVWSIALLMGILYTSIRAMILLLLFLTAGLLTYSIYSIGGAGGALLLVAPALIIIGCLFIGVSGVYQAFLSTYWTLSYRALYYMYTHTRKT